AVLADLVGPTATFAAISFVAYLLGSILMIRQWPPGMQLVEYGPSGMHAQLGFDEYLAWVNEISSACDGRISYSSLRADPGITANFSRSLEDGWRNRRYEAFEEVRKIYTTRKRGDPPLDLLPNDAWVRGSGKKGTLRPSEDSDWWNIEENLDDFPDQRDFEQAILASLDYERERIVTRIRVESAAIYDDYDRKRSEAELRYSMTVPLIAITGIVSFTWSWWFMAFLVVPVALLRDGYKIERESVERVLAAVQFGGVEAPVVETLKALLLKAEIRSSNYVENVFPDPLAINGRASEGDTGSPEALGDKWRDVPLE
ncbi:hypothetical protein, partial [Streptomyces rhizosphaericus]